MGQIPAGLSLVPDSEPLLEDDDEPPKMPFRAQNTDFYRSRARCRPWGPDAGQKRGRARDREQMGCSVGGCGGVSGTNLLLEEG